jgi:hypothetical protein
MDTNQLLTKRNVLIMSAIDTGLLIVLAILWPLTFDCRNTAASSQATCMASQPLGGFGVALFLIVAFVFTLLTMVVWLISMVKTGRVRAWLWFALCLIIPPIGSLLYGLFGPEEPKNEQPTYVEGTPRHPVTSS